MRVNGTVAISISIVLADFYMVVKGFELGFCFGKTAITDIGLCIWINVG